MSLQNIQGSRVHPVTQGFSSLVLIGSQDTRPHF